MAERFENIPTVPSSEASSNTSFLHHKSQDVSNKYSLSRRSLIHYVQTNYGKAIEETTHKWFSKAFTHSSRSLSYRDSQCMKGNWFRQFGTKRQTKNTNTKILRANVARKENFVQIFISWWQFYWSSPLFLCQMIHVKHVTSALSAAIWWYHARCTAAYGQSVTMTQYKTLQNQDLKVESSSNSRGFCVLNLTSNYRLCVSTTRNSGSLSQSCSVCRQYRKLS